MVIYKVDIQIKEARAKEWFQWMSTKHIRDVINTGHFIDFSFSELIPNGTIADPGFIKFEIRYYCRNMKELQNYEEKHANALRKEHTDRYVGDFKAKREIYSDVTDRMLVEVSNLKATA